MTSLPVLCNTCKALDLERAVFRPEGIQRASLGNLGEICKKANECALCNFIERVQLSLDKDQYECILSSQTKIGDVAADGELDHQSIYYNEILLEFRDIDGRYERNVTLEPCPRNVPKWSETISGCNATIPWMSPRAMEPLLPVGLLKHWIHICQDTHGSACGSPPWAAGVDWPQSLRLIDVKRNCIVTPPDKIRYVALSYVWGTPPSGIFKRNWLSREPANMRMRDSTIQSLQKEDSLLQAKLPITIREAMSLIDNLGETYLWVDCLCVIQDNAADLAIQIPQMDVIYANAAFTIVAGSGSSSDATLPRYHGPVNPRSVKGCRVTENLSLISRFHRSSHRTVFQDSTWMQRGWTFQEYLLSRRKIFLLKDRVYWQCESDFWDEGTVGEPRGDFTATKDGTGLDHWPLGLLKLEVDPPDYHYNTFTPFNQIISQYTNRRFNPTHEYDIANALHGVFRRLSSLGGDMFHWGLPQSRFEYFLLWREEKPFHRRRQCKLPMYEKSGDTWYIDIPSWSWMAWPGVYNMSPSEHEDRIFGPPKSDGHRNALLDWCKVDIAGRLWSLERPLQPVYDRSLSPPAWKTQTSLTSGKCTPDFKDSGRICTITSCATLTLRSLGGIPIVSSWGYLVPDIWEYAILDKSGASIGKMYGLSGDYRLLRRGTRKCNFVVIAESPRSLKDLKRVELASSLGTNDLWYLLHVLLVVWDRKRKVARRRGMFAVSEADWMRAGPESRLVTLG